MDTNYEIICQVAEWQRQELDAVEAEMKALRRYAGIKIKINRKCGDQYSYIYGKKPGDKGYQYYGNSDKNFVWLQNVRRLAHLREQRELIRSNIAELDTLIRNYQRTDHEHVQALLSKVYKEETVRPGRSRDELYLKNGGLIHRDAEPEIFRWADEILEDSSDASDYMSDEKKHISECGIITRSKSELLILNTMEREKVNVFYERLISLNGTPLLPDFMVYSERTKKTVFWEHFGLLNIDSYRENAERKSRLTWKTAYIPRTG